MLKAYTSAGLILGLSELNIEKLKAGQPIKFNLNELNHHPDAPRLPDLNIIILAGTTEKEMANELLKLCNKEAQN